MDDTARLRLLLVWYCLPGIFLLTQTAPATVIVLASRPKDLISTGQPDPQGPTADDFNSKSVENNIEQNIVYMPVQRPDCFFTETNRQRLLRRFAFLGLLKALFWLFISNLLLSASLRRPVALRCAYL